MRLLLIEDEARVAEALRRGLTADGFTVDHADNGIDGLWMAQEQQYSLVLLDVMLPGMNGFKVCQQLRERDDRTPILMVTAKLGEDDQIEGLEAGADDYLTKPFTYKVLLARVRALLRRSGTSPAGREIVVGDVRLDVIARRCWAGGGELTLSPRAFAVLEVLARHGGDVRLSLNPPIVVWGGRVR